MISKRTIFLFPTAMEAEPFRQLHPDACVVIGGVGMAATAASVTRLLVGDEALERIILAGIAGSYDVAQHPINKVFEVTREAVEELPERFVVRYEVAPRWGLPIVSSSTVNSSDSTCHRDAEIENMEGAALFAICEAVGIEASEIRAISNRVGAPVSEWSIGESIEALAAALSEIYKHIN